MASKTKAKKETKKVSKSSGASKAPKKVEKKVAPKIKVAPKAPAVTQARSPEASRMMGEAKPVFAAGVDRATGPMRANKNTISVAQALDMRDKDMDYLDIPAFLRRQVD